MAGEAEDLSESIRVVARLLAVSLVEGKTQADAIRLLGRTGMDRNEIARVCATTPDIVSVRLAEAKRQKKARVKRARRG